MPTVTAGELGWVVYSPPMEATVTEFEGNAYQGPRDGNLGMWYTPDTEAWLEVTDLGPLADTIHQIGEAGVIDTTLIVEDNDILVYALIARNIGFGVVGDPHTEIWRLELSADTSPTTEETVPFTTSPAVADDGLASIDQSREAGWSPILSTTKARSAPAAATCPEGSNPNAPGPIDQARPGDGPWSNQAAVFDTYQGRIVYVDEASETWTFDVCTNIWRAMDPAFVPDAAHLGEGQLVYDIDSDRTIAFGTRNVYAYDAAANTWTRRGSPDGRDPRAAWPGAVYDPISGLVLVQFDDGMLVAYDVDTDTWTEIGVISEPREITSEGQTQTSGPPFLVGHVAEADRLAFLGFGGAPFQDTGQLINPRTGEATDLADPPGGVTGGFGLVQLRHRRRHRIHQQRRSLQTRTGHVHLGMQLHDRSGSIPLSVGLRPDQYPGCRHRQLLLHLAGNHCHRQRTRHRPHHRRHRRTPRHGEHTSRDGRFLAGPSRVDEVRHGFGDQQGTVASREDLGGRVKACLLRPCGEEESLIDVADDAVVEFTEFIEVLSDGAVGITLSEPAILVPWVLE